LLQLTGNGGLKARLNCDLTGIFVDLVDNRESDRRLSELNPLKVSSSVSEALLLPVLLLSVRTFLPPEFRLSSNFPV
jgi:hypothetical protein